MIEERTFEEKVPSERNFGCTFGSVFLLIALYPALHGLPIRIWAVGLSLALFLLTFLYPKTLKIPNYIWFKFGQLLNRIIAPLVMYLTYFVIITPIAFITRFYLKDSLQLNSNKDANSYWIKRNNPIESMNKQF